MLRGALPAGARCHRGGSAPSSIAAIERALGAVIEDSPFKRQVSITPGRSYRSDVTDWGISGEGVYDFGGAELTSITAYRYNKYTRGQDADFNNLDILYRGDDGTAYNRFKTFTQELRLQGHAFGNHLDWLVGGYYANEKLTLADNLSFGATTAFAILVAANSFVRAIRPCAGLPRIQPAQSLRAGFCSATNSRRTPLFAAYPRRCARRSSSTADRKPGGEHPLSNQTDA